MTRRNLLKILTITCFYSIFLFLGMTQLELNFSRSSYAVGDLIDMFPFSAWIYLISLPFGLLFVYKFCKRLAWTIPFALAAILLIIFSFAQYPSTFHWDTFYHSATAKRVASEGHISPDMGYMVYPGTAIFSAIVSNILGLLILETSKALAAFWILLIVLILFCIGRLFAKTKVELADMSWLVPTIYLAFNFVLYNNYHYSPQLLGIYLYIFLVYVCVKKLRSEARTLNVILMLLLSTLTITHVFSGLISVVMLFCVYIGGTKMRASKLSLKRHIPLTLIMFGALVFLSWHIFVATGPFEESVSSLSALIKGEKTTIGPEAFLYNPREQWMLTPFLNLYRYGIYVLLGLASAVGLLFSWRKEEGKLVFWLAVGVLLGVLVIYLTPATFGIGRLVHYGAAIVSILSLFAIVKKNNGSHALTINRVFNVLRERASALFKVILPFLVIGTFLVTNLYDCRFVQFVHPDEIAAIEFVTQKNTRQISAVIEYAYLIPFFMREPLPMITIDERAPPDIAKITFEDGELSLQYLPRQLYSYKLGFVEGRNHLIYSNGLGRIYVRVNASSP